MVTVPTPPTPVAAHLEAARYALMRRLVPSMRHHLVVNLQPIGMIYEVMDRRLRAPQPDLANVQASVEKMNGFARAALRSCLDVVTWLAPEDEAVTTAVEGAHECAALLATSLGFRGFRLRNQIVPIAGDVKRSAMRSVLTATLIQCTDRAAAPAELVLSARATAIGLEVTVSLRAIEGEDGIAVPPDYRLLDWTDVEALALAEGVALERLSAASVVLGFPWVRAARA